MNYFVKNLSDLSKTLPGSAEIRLPARTEAGPFSERAFNLEISLQDYQLELRPEQESLNIVTLPPGPLSSTPVESCRDGAPAEGEMNAAPVVTPQPPKDSPKKLGRPKKIVEQAPTAGEEVNGNV